MTRPTHRTILILTLLAALALPAAAQETSSPTFFIERIEVRNASRVSPDVVVAESRLREGTEYSELDLRDAAARLNRLPFLLSAEFSLERGTERGRHALVITITETRPFFFRLDVVPVIDGDDAVEGGLNFEDSDLVGGAENEGILGFRFFLGRRGALHFGMFVRDDHRDYTRDYTALVVGYTQYDLFGTRAFATLNLKRPIGGVAEGKVSPQLVTGIPLSANQTLTLTYDETAVGRETGVVVLGELFDRRDSERLISARWAYNTTNHPFLPTNGVLLSATPLVAWQDGVDYVYLRDAAGSVVPQRETMHTTSIGIDLAGARYWELNDRDSISAIVETGWASVDERRTEAGSRVEFTHNPFYGIARAGFSHSLWDRAAQRNGDSRLEATLAYVMRQRHQRFHDPRGELIDRDVNSDRMQVSGSWVRRSSWGTVRLGLGYAW
jgi:outer membrane protein assembly factor BamA